MRLNEFFGKKVLITGHTGFKGAWLSLWLSWLGARVSGVSLCIPTEPSHFAALELEGKVQDYRLDIRDHSALKALVHEIQPDFVFHLAAQALVRRSYADPVDTWQTNTMGTINLLQALRGLDNTCVAVLITSDKCYDNVEWVWGYRETDPLGGPDPYSASKGAAELAIRSYVKSFFPAVGKVRICVGRAGNVIGGGDWSEDRLIPDLVRSIAARQSLEIRSPNATRPWQHVLESLSGYLLLGQKLIEGNQNFDGAWNFGPERSGNRTVADVLTRLQTHWPEMHWHKTAAPQLHEANLLYLDSAKAHNQLGWQPVWNLDTTLEKTADWYRAFQSSQTTISTQQLAQYVEAAQSAQVGWISA